MKKNINLVHLILIFLIVFIGILAIQRPYLDIKYQGNLLALLESEQEGSDHLINPNELNQIIKSSDVYPVFIKSTTLPNEFIPNTVVISIDDIEKVINGVRYIADKDKIEETFSKAGITDEDLLVIYDSESSPYSTKLYWTLKVYGHDYVKLLNGGLNNWINSGFNTTKTLLPLSETNYIAPDKNHKMIAKIDDIKQAMLLKDEIIIDVRDKASFDLGHIPTAINVPYNLALNTNGLFKSVIELEEIYQSKGVTRELSNIYIYCNYGRQSSFTYFVLSEILDYNNVVVYDGSFTEYKQIGLPIEK